MLWGRIFGAFFGYLFAGPFGILLGLFIGSAFDSGFSKHHAFGGHSAHQQVQETYFKATFIVMGHIAKADGRVSEDEIRYARQIINRMQLSQVKTKAAIDYFNMGKQPDFNLHAILSELSAVCNRQPLLLQMFVEVQFQTAMVDGNLGREKLAILNTICQQLGFMPLFNRFTSHQSSYQHSPHARPNSLATDYELLEVSPDTPAPEIKKTYRKLMSQNHPDKLIAQGLPEEMIKLATEKTQKIQTAYERIRQARGF